MHKRGCGVAIGVLLALAVLIAAAFLIQNPEKKVLSAETRAGLPGKFVALSDGVTHYQLSGPADGPLVVLVHGFSIASYSWERNVPALTDAGLRVLTYDLYGRGYSDRPQVSYNLDLFVRQLDELLTALGADQPVSLVGVSMGGYISAGFAVRHPERVLQVALLAPQTDAMGTDPRLKWVTLPELGEYLFTVYIGPYVLADRTDEFDAYMPSSDWHERYLEMMQYAGFRNALLSTLRNMTGDPFVEYRQLGSLKRPVLLLWGDLDDTVPIENAQKVRAAVPQAEYHVIPGARHASFYERPEIVNPLLVEFLKP
jgi:pimeloyl-ACP methyl ester carboxylesterase